VEELYLELLKKSLLGELYWENEVRVLYLRDCLEGRDTYSPATLLRIEERRREFCERYRELNKTGQLVDGLLENLGRQHTMIGRARLENVGACLERIRRAGTPGDLMECGVWRGGACIFMRGFLKAFGMEDRRVWVADSFAGPPAPRLPQDADEDLSAAKCPMLAISMETVRETFARYGLLDGQVRFLPGWFKDTLPQAPIERLALLRIDGDLYESTWDALSALYAKVSPGGFTIVDDYNCIPACRQAVDEYRQREAIEEPLEAVDWTGVYWQKASTAGR
jgi:O-methyltransferase